MSNTRVVVLVASLLVGACTCPRLTCPTSPPRADTQPLPIAAAEDRQPPALSIAAPVADVDRDHPGAASVLVTVRLGVRASELDPIRVRWATHEPGAGETRTAAAGVTTVRLGGLPIGRVWVEVAVPEGPVDAYTAAAWLELEPDQRTDLVFDFDRGYSVTGRLVDEHGSPVVDRSVSFSEPTEPPLDIMIASTRTDSRGSFRIDGLPRRPGVLTIFVLRHPGGSPSQAVEFQYQAVENVTPGDPPEEIVVRPFDPESHSVIVIGGGGGG